MKRLRTRQQGVSLVELATEDSLRCQHTQTQTAPLPLLGGKQGEGLPRQGKRGGELSLMAQHHRTGHVYEALACLVGGVAVSLLRQAQRVFHQRQDVRPGLRGEDDRLRQQQREMRVGAQHVCWQARQPAAQQVILVAPALRG